MIRKIRVGKKNFATDYSDFHRLQKYIAIKSVLIRAIRGKKLCSCFTAQQQ